MPSALLNPPYRLIVVLVLAISVIIVLSGSDNVTKREGDFRWRLPEVLDQLCPYDTSCHGGEARLKLNKDKESCCTECSCVTSCGLTDNCCYPDQAAIQYYDRSHQQCEIPSTKRDGRLRTFKRFYMVTSGYGNGSREDCGIGNATCGENETASVLGSLYPVSSKTTRLIYKNEQCARCHGVARGDMIPWKAVMSCFLDNHRVDTLLHSLETGRVHASCLLDFYYPGSQSEANAHICYDNTVRSCRYSEGEPYYVPSYLNMTEDEVRNACLTGPQAQYKQYYNIFCYLCRNGRYNAEFQCMKKDLVGRAPVPGTITVLLNPRILEKIAAAKRMDMETEAPIPVACKRQDGRQIVGEDCRPVLCPSGKARLGTGCVYLTTSLLTRRVIVVVHLYPRYHRNMSRLIYDLNTYLQQGTDWRKFVSAPGLESWRLSELCYHDNTHHAMKNGSAGFLWLKLTLEKTKNTSLANILANVETFMTGDWEFVFDTTPVPIEQNFSVIEDFEYDETANTFKPLYADLDLELSCTRLDPPERSFSMHITKTFFCDQVALKAEEYVIDKLTKILYVKAMGRSFSAAEFSLGFDAYGDLMPRLCLQDTYFVLVPQKLPASSSDTITKQHWSILVLVLYIVELMWSVY